MLNYSILKKSDFLLWRIISLFSKSFYNCATTFGSSIYMPDKYFNGELSETRKAALLLHEVAHVEQWQNEGIFFCLLWLFSKSHRKQYEMEAYKRQIKYIFREEGSIDIEAWAKTISSLYSIFNFISFEDAKKEIEEWIKIE